LRGPDKEKGLEFRGNGPGKTTTSMDMNLKKEEESRYFGVINKLAEKNRGKRGIRSIKKN